MSIALGHDLAEREQLIWSRQHVEDRHGAIRLVSVQVRREWNGTIREVGECPGHGAAGQDSKFEIAGESDRRRLHLAANGEVARQIGDHPERAEESEDATAKSGPCTRQLTDEEYREYSK